MRWYIIHENDIAWLQLWHQHLLDKSQVDLTIDRPWDAQRGAHSVKRQSPDGRDILAPCAGHGIFHAHSGLRPSVAARQAQITPHFVHEDELAGVPRSE